MASKNNAATAVKSFSFMPGMTTTRSTCAEVVQVLIAYFLHQERRIKCVVEVKSYALSDSLGWREKDVE